MNVPNKNKSLIDISVVIPVFNEEGSLIQLHDRISKVMNTLKLKYEVIYVNDGSKDSSLEKLDRISKENSNTTVVSLKKNYGQSSALHAGYCLSWGKWILFLDADLQNPPEEIPKLFAFTDNYDFISGVRADRKDGVLKRFYSLTAKIARNIILNDNTSDSGCGMQLFKKDIMPGLPLFNNFHRVLPFIMKLKGHSVKEVCIRHEPRIFGKSKYSMFKRARQGIFDIFGLLWLKKRNLHYEFK